MFRAKVFGKDLRRLWVPSCRGRYQSLSTHEAAAALRPFYFAVHPDFFGRSPKQRATNEESLKKVSEYLGNIQSKGRHCVQPLDVTFYVRKTDLDTNDVRPINIKLLDGDVRSTVSSILQSCDLPLDYVDSISPNTSGRGFERPVAWDHTYYTYTGQTPPPSQQATPSPTVRLASWLTENVPKGVQQYEATRPIREENDRRIGRLCQELGLRAIHWQSDWGYRNFRSSLRSFGRLVKDNADKLQQLHDRTVIFSDRTGVSLTGEIRLGCGDFTTDWLHLLTHLRQHEATLAGLPELESRVSHLLRGIQIVRRTDQGVVMAREYDGQLRALIDSIERCWKAKRDILGRDLSHLQLVVECSSGPLALSHVTGQFLTPSSCPGSLLVEFLAEHKHAAAALLKEYQRKVLEADDVKATCRSHFELASLDHDRSLCVTKVKQCCNDLLTHGQDLVWLLSGTRVYIGPYYLLKDDGMLLIPWDWYSRENITNNI